MRTALLGLSKLSVWWMVLGIDLERGRPGCPQDNPAHERFHLDIARELEGSAQSEQQAFLDQWRREYNEERPHQRWASVAQPSFTPTQQSRMRARLKT